MTDIMQQNIGTLIIIFGFLNLKDNWYKKQ